jgi:hypothetical protein
MDSINQYLGFVVDFTRPTLASTLVIFATLKTNQPNLIPSRLESELTRNSKAYIVSTISVS